MDHIVQHTQGEPMKEELIALREEIQRDRIEMTKSMNDGFDRVMDKFTDHEVRLADVERTQKLFKGGFVVVSTTAISSFFAWIFGR